MRYGEIMSRRDSDGTTAFPPWLYESQIEGEGGSALYPYAQLRNILAPEDVRAAISDECGPIETELGIHAVEPFHQLLWLLNTIPAFFTTHVNVAPRDLKPPFEWARTQVAAQIIMLSRNPTTHDHRAPAEALAAWLAKLLCSAPHVADSSEWMISVGPTPMTLIRLRTPECSLSVPR